jgi:hypothetical protein
MKRILAAMAWVYSKASGICEALVDLVVPDEPARPKATPQQLLQATDEAIVLRTAWDQRIDQQMRDNLATLRRIEGRRLVFLELAIRTELAELRGIEYADEWLASHREAYSAGMGSYPPHQTDD